MTGNDPGGWDARKKGCTCPVIQNNFGNGVKDLEGDSFYISPNCPLHGRHLSNPLEDDE